MFRKCKIANKIQKWYSNSIELERFIKKGRRII